MIRVGMIAVVGVVEGKVVVVVMTIKVMMIMIIKLG